MRVELGKGYLAQWLLTAAIVPALILSGGVLGIFGTRPLTLGICGTIAILVVVYCFKRFCKPGEYVEVDDRFLRIHLSDWKLEVLIDQIESIREIKSSSKWTYDDSLCDHVGIYLKNGSVHTPPLRPGLLSVVQKVAV